MEFSFWKWAAADRNRVALVDDDGTEVTAGELLDTSNQVARNLRARGLKTGDVVAFCLHNQREVFELVLAAMQSGLYFVPINWHLTRHEIAYIVDDSEAKLLLCSPDLAEACRKDGPILVCTGDAPGFEPFAAYKTGPTDPPEDRRVGGVMNYTSGTTGRPKGVKRPLPPVAPEPVVTAFAAFLLMYGMKPGEGVHLVGSPLYHTAVLYFANSALHLGQQLVLVEKWSAKAMLERVEKYRVTSSHMVPTQFSRLLAFEERGNYDVSSLKHMVHSAAPCPVPVKRAMLDWWGDVVFEYYAASEGGGTMVRPEEWRRKPGTVGKPWQTADIAIFDDEGNRLPADTVGTVYIKMAQGFEYHKDQEKTKKAHNTAGWFTVGDAGYLDADGYLFLCDRKADLIISGGANIYPAEVESVMSEHPAVLDVAVFGIPDADWGESVLAVVEPRVSHRDRPAAELEADILRFCKERLAKFKTPRRVEFVTELPRDPNGKLAKRTLRDPYWAGLQRQI